MLTGAGTRDVAMVERVAAAGAAVLSDRADDVAELASRGYQRIVYLSTGPSTRPHDEDNAVERGHHMSDENVLVLGSRPCERIDSAWTLPGLGDVPDILAVLPFVVVAQLFALRTSLSLGIIPDSPSPLGQVNRVVKCVTVHPHGGR